MLYIYIYGTVYFSITFIQQLFIIKDYFQIHEMFLNSISKFYNYLHCVNKFLDYHIL